MATSTYFNHYNNITEQRLLEDLVIESIKLYGHDVYYLPRTSVNEDLVLGEDVLEKFSSSYFVEMYLNNDNSINVQLSKFYSEYFKRVFNRCIKWCYI